MLQLLKVIDLNNFYIKLVRSSNVEENIEYIF